MASSSKEMRKSKDLTLREISVKRRLMSQFNGSLIQTLIPSTIQEVRHQWLAMDQDQKLSHHNLLKEEMATLLRKE